MFVAALAVVAFLLRVYGLNWDRGLFFHPDERQILMVASRLSWPRSLREFFSSSSPLNPHFFAYGSLPLYLLRGLSALLGAWRSGWAEMHRFYLLGRLLSAFFDTVTVLATWALARKLYGQRVAALSAAFVSLSVLHIQMAHFYTSDPLLTCLILLAVNKAVDVAAHGTRRDGVWLGILLGMALATKVSVLPLIAVVAVAWLASSWPQSAREGPAQDASRNPGVRRDARAVATRVAAGVRQLLQKLRIVWRNVGASLILTYLLAALCFALLQPYALLDAYSFVAGIGQEVAMAQGWYDFPYTRQYAGTQPFGYQVRQLLLFGMGPPLGMLCIAGFLCWVWRVWWRPQRVPVVVLTWPVLYVLMQAWTYAKFMRYLLPLSPFLCLAGAALWVQAWDKAHRMDSARAGPLRSWRELGRGVARPVLGLLLVAVLGYTAFYALSFLNVYRQPHTWIQGSDWLCSHAPAGSTILTEYWDDPLPAQGANSECSARIVTLTVDFHTLDSDERLEELLSGLQQSDYIVLSSQRLYAPLSRQPWFFPLASRYYRALFAERLGFRLVAAPAVYPHLAGVTFLDNPRAELALPTPPLLAAARPPGWVLDLGQADESFTVYDHPQPLIFAKTQALAREELLNALNGQLP
jgi:hypothetical protein